MILYRNTKVKVRSPDKDTEYFDIVAGVLQGDTIAPYLFIICLDYMLRTSIDKIRENCFELTKKRSRRYPAKTITDADYADNIALRANTPNQAETLLHYLDNSEWIFGYYKLNVLTLARITTIMYDFLPVLLFRFFFFSSQKFRQLITNLFAFLLF